MTIDERLAQLKPGCPQSGVEGITMTHPTGPRPTDEERETWRREARSPNHPSNTEMVLSTRILTLLDDLATLRAERDEATAGLRRYADALLLAWGGVCPSNWATTGDPMEMAETMRARGDELQAAEASRDARQVERDEFYDNYIGACQTVAAMHEAATGRKGEAPVRGVVEDVADLKSERDALTAQVAANRQITFCENCGANWCDDGNNMPECPYCLITRERAAHAVVKGVRGNMLRYIAFVSTGDEAGDPQLGVDRLKAESTRLTAQVAALTEAADRALRLAEEVANTWGVFARRGKETEAVYQMHVKVLALRAALPADAPQEGKS